MVFTGILLSRVLIFGVVATVKTTPPLDDAGLKNLAKSLDSHSKNAQSLFLKKTVVATQTTEDDG
eukprot:CAMPEP_0171669300 /NCGR_PEP_ID=MMETSP0990-20121206/49881_1 /TAXON_ID=483369 /ORGANISM="non described non described, Strain CCMP2098" /LENGTH=64 /DNA_ID=CAMNT_0012253511 /DNA_START=1 /DNA_END=191 /DNA_ORIENTATION=-